MDVNKVILLGRFTSDPVVKKMKSGVSVCRSGLATNMFWKNAKTKKTESSVEFHNLVFWGKLAEVVEKYLKKGDKVYTEGRIHSRVWEGNKGEKNYRTEVIVKELVMLGEKKNEDQNKEIAVEEIVIDEEE